MNSVHFGTLADKLQKIINMTKLSWFLSQFFRNLLVLFLSLFCLVILFYFLSFCLLSLCFLNHLFFQPATHTCSLFVITHVLLLPTYPPDFMLQGLFIFMVFPCPPSFLWHWHFHLL